MCKLLPCLEFVGRDRMGDHARDPEKVAEEFRLNAGVAVEAAMITAVAAVTAMTAVAAAVTAR